MLLGTSQTEPWSWAPAHGLCLLPPRTPEFLVPRCFIRFSCAGRIFLPGCLPGSFDGLKLSWNWLVVVREKHCSGWLINSVLWGGAVGCSGKTRPAGCSPSQFTIYQPAETVFLSHNNQSVSAKRTGPVSFFPFSSVIRRRVAAHFSVRPGPVSIVIDFDYTHGSITSCLLICIFNCRKQFSDFNIIAHHREELEDFAQRFKLKRWKNK